GFAEIRMTPGLVECGRAGLKPIEGVCDRRGGGHICIVHIELITISDHQSIGEVYLDRRRCRELIAVRWNIDPAGSACELKQFRATADCEWDGPGLGHGKK